MTQVNQYIDQIIKLKNTINVFKDLDDAIIKYIVKDVKFLKFDVDESIITFGDCDEYMFILIQGECRVLIDTKEQVGILKKNQVFGEFAQITKSSRTATVITNEPTTLLAFKIDFDLLNKKLGGYGILYTNFIKELVKKLHMTNLEKRKEVL